MREPLCGTIILYRLLARDRSVLEHIIIEADIEVEYDLEGLCEERVADTLLGEKG